MNWRHHTLPLAALSIGAALILGAISLTIAVLSMLTPLTPDQLKVVEGMGGINFRNTVWIVPALTLATCVSGLVEVALRRPFGWSAARTASTEVTGSTITTFGFAASVVVILAAWSIKEAVHSIRLSGDRPITGCDAFAGLSVPIGLISLMCWTFATLLLRRWWQEERGAVRTTP